MADEGYEIDEDHTHEGEPDPATERTTAPQSPYSMRDVGVGALIAAIGMALVFVLPYLLT